MLWGPPKNLKKKAERRKGRRKDGKKEGKTERKKPVVHAKVGAHMCHVQMQHIFTYGGATHPWMSHITFERVMSCMMSRLPIRALVHNKVCHWRISRATRSHTNASHHLSHVTRSGSSILLLHKSPIYVGLFKIDMPHTVTLSKLLHGV